MVTSSGRGRAAMGTSEFPLFPPSLPLSALLCSIFQTKINQKCNEIIDLKTLRGQVERTPAQVPALVFWPAIVSTGAE